MNKTSKIEPYRLLVQTLSLLVFLGLFIKLVYPLEWRGTALLWFSHLDPWFFLSQLRWQQRIPVWSWLPLLTLLITALGGRVFCGWLCPLGSLLAWMDKLGRTVFPRGRNIRIRIVKSLHPYRYFWLLLLLAIFVLGSNWVLFFTPFILLSHELMRILQGSWPWLLIVLLTTALLLSRLWCSFFCPTGLLLSFTSRWALFAFTTYDACTKCGKCSKICPVDASPAAPGEAREWCLVCGDCRDICPVQVISYEQHKSPSAKPGLDVPAPPAGSLFSRRQFALLGLTLVTATLLWRKAAEAALKVLRPPGALEETKFSEVCSRCGRCIRVCPNQALWPLKWESGWADMETPVLIPRLGRCDLCMACQEVCPTGAIATVPIEQVKIGQARVDKERCLAWSEYKLCFLCGEQCPFQAISGDRWLRPTVLADKCIGCGACENGCPVIGEAAIRVYPN